MWDTTCMTEMSIKKQRVNRSILLKLKCERTVSVYSSVFSKLFDHFCLDLVFEPYRFLILYQHIRNVKMEGEGLLMKFTQVGTISKKNSNLYVIVVFSCQ